jgi:hypothetical protein
MVTVNVVVLAGSVAADPVVRRMPSGDEVTELRLSVPEAGKRLLPLPIAAWHATAGPQALDAIVNSDRACTGSSSAQGVEAADFRQYLIAIRAEVRVALTVFYSECFLVVNLAS